MHLSLVCSFFFWSAVFFFNFDENDTKNWLATIAYLCPPCYFSFCSLHQYIWYSASKNSTGLATIAYLCPPCYFSFCSLHQYIWYSASNILHRFPKWGRSDNPKGGAPNYYLANFSQNLDENEVIGPKREEKVTA